MDHDGKPRSDRYRISGEVQLRAVIHRRGSLDPIDVQLADVSSNGIRLRVPVCLQFEESITVHMFAPEVDFDIEVAAFVKWLRPAEKDDWFVGCRVRPVFSDEALTHLASMGCVERRGLPRREVQFAASACGEAEQTRKSVTLHNLSEDGFGMSSVEPFFVPQRITVRLQGLDGKTFDVVAQVEWQIRAAEGYLCGCSFANGRSYSRLCQLIETESDGVEPSESATDERPNRESLWVALAVLIVFIFPSLFVLSREVAPASVTVAEQKRRSTSGGQADSPAADSRLLQAIPAAAEATANENSKPGQTQSQTAEVYAVQATQISEESSAVAIEYRVWVDSTGQHRAVARLLAVEGNTVHMQKEDGRRASVSLDRLSAADAQYVRRWLIDSQ